MPVQALALFPIPSTCSIPQHGAGAPHARRCLQPPVCTERRVVWRPEPQEVTQRCHAVWGAYAACRTAAVSWTDSGLDPVGIHLPPRARRPESSFTNTGRKAAWLGARAFLAHNRGIAAPCFPVRFVLQDPGYEPPQPEPFSAPSRPSPFSVTIRIRPRKRRNPFERQALGPQTGSLQISAFICSCVCVNQEVLRIPRLSTCR